MTTPEYQDASEGFDARPQAAGYEASPSDPRQARPEGTAAYIADMTKELSSLARAAGLETLAYVLDIAQLEASGVVRRAGEGTTAR